MVRTLERDYYSIDYVCDYLNIDLDDLIHFGEIGRLTFYVKILGKSLTVLMQAFDDSDDALNAGESNLINEVGKDEIYTGLASLRAIDIMKIMYTGDLQFAVLEILEEQLNCTNEFMDLYNSSDIRFEFSYTLKKIDDVNIKDVFIKTVDVKYLESILEATETECQTSNSLLAAEINNKYPPELDYALRAWQAVSSNEGKGKPKARIRKWLDENTALSNEAKERISIVANWDKLGGATKT